MPRGPLFFSADESESAYYFKIASDPSASVLTINKYGPAFSSPESFPAGGVKTISGILGVITLRAGKYVIIATKSEQVGVLLDSPIFKVTGFDVLPLQKKASSVLEVIEDDYLSLLKSHLKTAPLYFSYSYDLSSSLQKSVDPHTSNEEFVWNSFILESIRDMTEKENPFLFPVIYGYVNVASFTFHGSSISFGLISRRSVYRAGTRYFRRGIDAEGHVANYNETEQILVVNDKTANNWRRVYSYLQIRGSVPVYWAEINNLRYKPLLRIAELNIEPAKKHFKMISEQFEKVYLVNLVNQKGYEKPVKEAYETLVSSLDSPLIDYTYFDFHHECRKMRWDRVDVLIDTLEHKGFQLNDYFVAEKTGNSVKVTVQSMIAKKVLQKQLEDSGILPPQEQWASDKRFELIFRQFWADNANAVSLAYSGTGALKTDFTRTGKRTKAGAFMDFINSASRYIKNNFLDGPRQDAYDLILGNHLPYETLESPFIDRRPLLTQAVPYVLFASIILMVALIFFPKASNPAAANLGLLLVCFFTMLFCLNFLLQNGTQFVNWPKLMPLDFLSEREVPSGGKSRGIVYKENPQFETVSEKARLE